MRGFAIRLSYRCTAGHPASTAVATENRASVYPAGVDTVVPGLAPAPGKTLFLEFTDYYTANGVANSKGQNELPGFRLRVAVFAPKIVHNWGVHFLGGTVTSSAALPFVYESLNTPFGAQAKTGFSNPGFEPAAIAYVKGDWHWWYGLDLYTPGFPYTKSDLINIGQHNFAYAPAGAFTFLPKHGRLEISSKYQFIINGVDSATNYKSGNEFLWEYDGMVPVTRQLSIGGNGYFYRQVTADLKNGLVVRRRSSRT